MTARLQVLAHIGEEHLERGITMDARYCADCGEEYDARSYPCGHQCVWPTEKRGYQSSGQCVYVEVDQWSEKISIGEK